MLFQSFIPAASGTETFGTETKTWDSSAHLLLHLVPLCAGADYYIADNIVSHYSPVFIVSNMRVYLCTHLYRLAKSFTFSLRADINISAN